MVDTPKASHGRVRILRWMAAGAVWLCATSAHASTDAGVYAFAGATESTDAHTQATEIAPAGAGARSVHLGSGVRAGSGGRVDVRGMLPLGGVAAFALVAPLLWRRKRAG